MKIYQVTRIWSDVQADSMVHALDAAVAGGNTAVRVEDATEVSQELMTAHLRSRTPIAFRRGSVVQVRYHNQPLEEVLIQKVNHRSGYCWGYLLDEAHQPTEQVMRYLLPSLLECPAQGGPGWEATPRGVPTEEERISALRNIDEPAFPRIVGVRERDLGRGE